MCLKLVALVSVYKHVLTSIDECEHGLGLGTSCHDKHIHKLYFSRGQQQTCKNVVGPTTSSSTSKSNSTKDYF